MCLQQWLTNVIIKLLQQCFIQLDDKGPCGPVFQQLQDGALPLGRHLVQGRLDAILFAGHV